MEIKDIHKKKKTEKRKAEKKMKLMMKKAGFNINAVRHEIYSYQLYLRHQHAWKQPYWIIRAQSNNNMKNKDQQHISPGVNT